MRGFKCVVGNETTLVILGFKILRMTLINDELTFVCQLLIGFYQLLIDLNDFLKVNVDNETTLVNIWI